MVSGGQMVQAGLALQDGSFQRLTCGTGHGHWHLYKLYVSSTFHLCHTALFYSS